MRRSRRSWLFAAIAVPLGVATACITPLDDEFTGSAPSPPASGDDDAAVAAGCLPFASTTPVAAVAGDLHSLETPDSGSLWIASQASAPDGGVTLAATFSVAPGAAAACSAWSATFDGTAFDPSPLDPAGLLVTSDLVQTAAGPWAYYAAFTADSSMPFGIRLLGYGVAPRNPVTGRFSPSASLLWSADRPGYGASALAAGAYLYVHGCKSNAPLTDDCYVARVDPASLDSASAYRYWTGSAWSSNPDDAAPIARASAAVSVRADPTGKARFLMTYVEPFGKALIARSAVAPEGPWSDAVELARCGLDPAIPGAFCGGGRQHPELSTPGGPLVLSYDARTFDTDGGPDVTGYWPRLVALGVPAALP